MRKNMLKYRKLAENNAKLKNSKGITLIALVVTIIVLLILAGVSISAITGDAGIMNKAKEAKRGAENADELEAIQLAVLEAVKRSRTGIIDVDDLNNALEGLIEADVEGEGPWTVVGKSGITYYISTDGEVSNFSGIIVNPGSYRLIINEKESVNLTAKLPPSLEGKTIQWQIKGDNAGSLSLSSVEGSTTTVSLKEGAVAGKATVVAKIADESEEGICTITVAEGTTESPSSIVLTQNGSSVSPITLNVGESATAITGKIISDKNKEMTELTVSFLSGNTTVATVNSSGVITGAGEGSTTIIGYYDANANGNYDNGEIYASVGVTVNDSTPTVAKLISQTTTNGSVTALSTTENITIKDAKNNDVIIPAGFGIASDSGATVDAGIVIEDASNGNQFVWVPVGTITKSDGSTVTINMSRREFAEDGTATERAADYIIDSSYTETTSNTVARKNASGNIEAVEQATAKGGFYIGRYETGNENVRKSNVSKANVNVYNHIKRNDAIAQAQSMYPSTDGVKFKSDLVNSYAWDTAIYFIQQCGTNSKYSQQIGESLTNTSIPQNTGTNLLAKDKDGNNLDTGVIDVQCNIYDMAGNVSEWTTEYSSQHYSAYVIRGGDYGSDAGNAGDRMCRGTTTISELFGFRALLYIM